MVNLPQINSSALERHKVFMLFETRSFDKNNFMSYIFTDPVRVITAENPKQVRNAFSEIEEYAERFYIAGYFSYELGYCFENEIFAQQKNQGRTLLKVGIFRKRFYFNHQSGKNNIDIPGIFLKNYAGVNFSVDNLELNINPQDYRKKITQIKEFIKEGQTYQVNFTSKYNFNFSGSAFDLYRKLCSRQQVQYSAFIRIGDEKILSLSPELFFRRKNDDFYSEPMKGTISRGNTPQEDKANLMRLKRSLKNKAENLMIVDLIRNDLGRISRTGSVKVSQAFRIRKYKTLFQMISGINGKLKKNISYFEIFKNIFPGGSVTGAPKLSTMQIIRKLEKGPRGVYCGALGFISPAKEAIFNLPIRTVHINGGKGEMGVGSGIVQDSRWQEEFRECCLKAKFFSDAACDFKLIETIGWDKEYCFIGEHIARLKQAAQHFGFVFMKKKIFERLKTLESRFVENNKYRIRLLLDREGSLKFEYNRISPCARSINYVAVSKYRMDPKDEFIYYKTTNRLVYDSEYARYNALGYFDVLFLNTRNEFTEGAISNIIIQKKGKFFTPPLSSGILPGIYRGDLLRKRLAEEKRIFWKDIAGADKIFLCNSVRGLTEVKLRKCLYTR